MLQWEQFNSIQHRAKLIDNFTVFNFTNLYIVITEPISIGSNYVASIMEGDVNTIFEVELSNEIDNLEDAKKEASFALFFRAKYYSQLLDAIETVLNNC